MKKKKPTLPLPICPTMSSGIQAAIKAIKKAQAHVPTDREFRTALAELCFRYCEALNRWGAFKVHFRPKARKKKDQERHALLWTQAELAKHDLAQTAAGLLGLHDSQLSNDVARGRLGGLLEAAAARKSGSIPRPRPAKAPAFPAQSAVILGTALLLDPKGRR